MNELTEGNLRERDTNCPDKVDEALILTSKVLGDPTLRLCVMNFD
jgi:hypothetical protein